MTIALFEPAGENSGGFSFSAFSLILPQSLENLILQMEAVHSVPSRRRTALPEGPWPPPALPSAPLFSHNPPQTQEFQIFLPAALFPVQRRQCVLPSPLNGFSASAAPPCAPSGHGNHFLFPFFSPPEPFPAVAFVPPCAFPQRNHNFPDIPPRLLP